jgi:hypothetical protein
MPTDATDAISILERLEVMFGPAGTALVAFIIVLLTFIWLMIKRHEAERDRIRGDAKEAFIAVKELGESSSESREALGISMADFSKELQFIREKLNDIIRRD